ncbi:HIT family protein [Alicyclobacillus sp. ALC3]|uniref:HIT family protein n=1 Tax=Alicyclobacillus sp. ALC3 TaxID=2796143 RepID=UPI0023791816|nr:HIT domain-containing protein [Alicyclobacillus sp. ALC3]WDL97183.1 HIT domain-containing protein [Alicyclobacillus sp. ALC3]
MRKITLADGHIVEVECLSCAVTSGLVESSGGVIYEDELFHAHQDVAYPIPGLVILASKRHFYRMDELTAAEATRYINLIKKIRAAQSEQLGVNHVYYFYNEDTTHHFHLWMVPRYEWMGQFGKSVESLRPSLLHARQSMSDEKNVAYAMDCIDKLRNALSH